MAVSRQPGYKQTPPHDSPDPVSGLNRALKAIRRSPRGYEADDGPIGDEALTQLRASANKDLPSGELINKEELFPPEIEPVPIKVHKPEPSDSQ
jgi:hypothetical protein